MPDRARIEAFIALVEQGRFVEAIEGFYTAEASMQENLSPPRTGCDNLVAHERRVIAAHSEVRARCERPYLVEGDHVAIRWIFDMVDRSGTARRLDEVALQRWDGDRIAWERFYYDPALLRG